MVHVANQQALQSLSGGHYSERCSSPKARGVELLSVFWVEEVARQGVMGGCRAIVWSMEGR
eukprot:12182882-Alexandrium_andersonii.AAC.1